ncbi:MAG: hypothetical protein HQM11_17715 [SAR324 cluster bacterium]|nr:hypothetical protein [SAR324 cluster bacterium]
MMKNKYRFQAISPGPMLLLSACLFFRMATLEAAPVPEISWMAQTMATHIKQQSEQISEPFTVRLEPLAPTSWYCAKASANEQYLVRIHVLPDLQQEFAKSNLKVRYAPQPDPAELQPTKQGTLTLAYEFHGDVLRFRLRWTPEKSSGEQLQLGPLEMSAVKAEDELNTMDCKISMMAGTGALGFVFTAMALQSNTLSFRADNKASRTGYQSQALFSSLLAVTFYGLTGLIYHHPPYWTQDDYFSEKWTAVNYEPSDVPVIGEWKW